MLLLHYSFSRLDWRQIDEYGRMVYDGQPEKPPPIRDEDRAPFWEGLGDKISEKISEFDTEKVCRMYNLPSSST